MQVSKETKELVRLLKEVYVNKMYLSKGGNSFQPLIELDETQLPFKNPDDSISDPKLRSLTLSSGHLCL